MKNIQLFLLLLLSVFIYSSCEKDDPDGKWDDNIKLSSKWADLEATADSATFTTEGTWWWVTEITINDSTYFPADSINLEADSYVIQVEDVVVERKDANTLFVKAQENTTGEERTIRVGLEAGDYFDSVTVTQAAN